MQRIYFYNTFHNGDVHYSRTFVRDIMNKLGDNDYYYLRDTQFFLEAGDIRVRDYGVSVVEEIITRYPALDGIHLDMSELIQKYDGKIASISNTTEIQQISLFCQQNRNDYRKPVLMDMINPQFAFAGLYPHIMKPFDPDIATDITNKGQEILRKLIELRKINK